MKLQFPEGFLFGTSTSALQIESAFDHDWNGLKARDGAVLDRNIEHELHRDEDAEIIASLGNAYRCSCDWSRLQRSPKGQLEANVIQEYRDFLGKLKDKGLHLMLVLHHFANPNWFVREGSWGKKNSTNLFKDYAAKMAEAFGDLVDSWNTINEPGVYASLGYLLGEFPPHKRDFLLTRRVLKNMGDAHERSYKAMKEKRPEMQIGISKNTVLYTPESPLGHVVRKVLDWMYMDYVSEQFRDVDFVGMSYYGRVPFRPFPITETDNPGKLDELGRCHDKMLEYYPEGLKVIMKRMQDKYGDKPIIITEHGCCTDDDNLRVKSIRDHLKVAHEAMQEGIDLRGYFHWSTFDNFELYLGPSYRFGLVYVDPETLERIPKESAKVYAKIAEKGCLEV
jgi:beta-glucosidase